MCYLLIRQIDKLPHLGLKDKEKVLTSGEAIAKMNDEQLDHVEQIAETFTEMYSGQGFVPSERDKTILQKHHITVTQEIKNQRRPRFVLATPFGKLMF